MAPRKRKAEGGEEAPAEKPVTTSVRTTRSATLRANSEMSQSATELPKNKAKKAKPASKQKKKEAKSEENDSEKEKPEVEAAGDESEKRTIVIEHCKQCNSFKTRANLVKEGLEKDVAGIKVVLNPEKPRRGCFEIREKGGETFISLLDMKRPFKPMKDLDMDKVISDIVEKLN